MRTTVFIVPDSFHDPLLRATQVLKTQKNDLNLIQPELFKLEPHHFAYAALALWRAVGRISDVPPLLTSSLLSLIYNRKGDPSFPTNYRPMSLPTSYRRLIETALNLELRKAYETAHGKWGFQPGSNTECAIAYVIKQRWHSLPLKALLDVRKV